MDSNESMTRQTYSQNTIDQTPLEKLVPPPNKQINTLDEGGMCESQSQGIPNIPIPSVLANSITDNVILCIFLLFNFLHLINLQAQYLVYKNYEQNVHSNK